MTIHSFIQTKLQIALWSKLNEVLDALASGKKRILIRSANGVGKTALLAAICNWKLATHKDSIVLTTASSHTQVRRNLWGEIRAQARLSKLFGKKQIHDTVIQLDDKHYAIGISPREPENAQGFHSRSMLIAIDEATGVDREIINALMATATGDDTQIVMIYNPMTSDSFVYEAERSGEWHIITIGAMEHPNVIIEEEAIVGAVTCDSIRERLRSWSYEVAPHSDDGAYIDNKWWRKTSEMTKRILGEWAEDSGEGFIPMHLIKRAVVGVPPLNLPHISGGDLGTFTLRVNDPSPSPSTNVEGDRSKSFSSDQGVARVKALGVDIARGGEDETVFSYFDGDVQTHLRAIRTKDILTIAELIADDYANGYAIIAIDDTGIGGGVADILRSRGIPHHAVNFAQSAKGFFRQQRKQLANARAEMYFVLDDELKRGVITLADDAMLHQELASVRLKMNASTEAYLLESKDDIKSRLGRSPDRADATALARYGVKLQTLEWRKRLL